MSTSTSPDRPNRLVVALGIATIILFSANLLSMISQRVWPKLQEMAVFGGEKQAEEVAPAGELHMHVFTPRVQSKFYHFQATSKRSNRCYRRRTVTRTMVAPRSNDAVEQSIESDMDRLERDIEREMERLNTELSGTRSDLQRGVRVRLRVNGGDGVQIEQNKLDLSEMEAKIEGITKQFEVRIREHEAAARSNANQ